MIKNEFFRLADTVFDNDATEAQLSHFEQIVEIYPEFLDEWIDQKSALHASLGLEPIEASPDFSKSVVARWQAQKIKLSIQYWMPTAFAAVAAAVGLFAILQVLGTPVQSATFGAPEAEARLDSSNSVTIPTLDEPLTR